ncbi:MAG: sigma-70 family RNA polymerase sigma factor [Acidobacteriota bacterium]
MTSDSEITQLLEAWTQKNPGAVDRLLPLVFEELRLLARSHFRREGTGHTLQPTAIINELYLRLVEQHSVRFTSRAEFFAFASRLMRRILVDHYRQKQVAKRGGGAVRVTLDEALRVTSQEPVDLLTLDEALNQLERLDPRQHRVVELRYFGGLTNAQTARVMEISKATVKREWSTARAWLRHQLEP